VPAKKEDGNTEILVKKNNFPISLDRKKELKVCGKKFAVDPRQLIRMIKNITQTIGEYKNQENPSALYVVAALRSARANVAADLENTFNIHWQIDENTGKSIFTL
jgi:hypothetical protein